jgi:hypothetical protein
MLKAHFEKSKLEKTTTTNETSDRKETGFSELDFEENIKYVAEGF